MLTRGETNIFTKSWMDVLDNLIWNSFLKIGSSRGLAVGAGDSRLKGSGIDSSEILKAFAAFALSPYAR